MATSALDLAGAGPLVTPRRSVLVVLTAAMAMFITNGFVLIGLTVFDPLLLERLHVSVGALKTGDAVTLITAAVLSPLSGYLLDRLGVRPIMAIGMIFMAVGLYAYAHAASLIQVYLIHVLFGVGLVTAGLFVCIVLITGVTARNRGLAVGAVLAGSSLGSALSPRLDVLMEAHWGWRDTLQFDAILPLLLIPVILLVVAPKQRSRKLEVRQDATVLGPAGPTYADALRTRSFWLLSIVAMVSFFTELGVLTNLVIYVERQLGQSREAASGALLTISGVALVVQLSAGALIDRVGVKPVHLVSILVMGLGVGMLALAPATDLLPAVALVGLGWGGNYAALQTTTSKLFAGAAVGRILGTINIIEAAGAGLGPFGVGWLYDATHSYALPFGIAGAAVMLASVAVALVASPKRWQAS